MIFNKTDETLWGNTERRSAAQELPPRKRLSLIKETIFYSGNKFLRFPGVVAVIAEVVTRQRHKRAVMKIVVPHPIQIVTAFTQWPCHFGLLQIVFGDEENGTRPGSLAGGAPHFGDDVFFGFIANGVRSVEPKAIEMKFLDPITPIGHEKFAHWFGVFPVEIDHIAPFMSFAADQIIVGKNSEIISVGSEVVINDVENNTDA